MITYRLAWIFIATDGFVLISILMAWASIERHILIFYPNLVATKAKRFFFHYLPLAIGILWPTIFYCVTFLILPCDIPFSYHGKTCRHYVCILIISQLSLFDSVAHYILPAFITVSFSVALLACVLYHRYRIRGRIDWRNYKKMVIQLLPVSVLYISLQLPPMILCAGYSGGLVYTVGNNYYGDALFFNYWVILFTPFASVMSLPELRTKCRNVILFWRRRRVVAPETLMVARSRAGQTPAAVITIR
jgi:hypothetical protein